MLKNVFMRIHKDIFCSPIQTNKCNNIALFIIFLIFASLIVCKDIV